MTGTTTAGPAYKPARANGKSNQQVVVELVSAAEPGTTFTYEALGAALAEGTDREFGTRDVQQVVRLANRRLLREHSRCLRSVPTVGYALAHARDHRELAGARNRRGQRQFKWAMETLRNARMDEMTEQERAVHVAQLDINTALYQQNRRVLRRQEEQGRLIASLTQRVEQMEAKT